MLKPEVVGVRPAATAADLLREALIGSKKGSDLDLLSPVTPMLDDDEDGVGTIEIEKA